MKIRRLSEIDLARFCALPEERLEVELHGYEAGGGSWSYDPARASASDAVDAKTPLLGAIPTPTWLQIEAQVIRACRGEDQRDSNLGVTKALFEYARKHGWRAVKEDMGRMPIGVGETVRYWFDLVVDDGDGAFIPFFDHRRERGVANAEIRKVVHSMQDVWVRSRIPDLQDARLATIQFPKLGDGRGISIEFADEAELLSYEELNRQVQTVYRVWELVIRERRKRGDRGGAAGGGSLL